jgi:hypothetical protein
LDESLGWARQERREAQSSIAGASLRPEQPKSGTFNLSMTEKRLQIQSQTALITMALVGYGSSDDEEDIGEEVQNQVPLV